MIINPIIKGGGGASAELDGNALPADVLTGKTFYNTDPEAKLTGSMTDRSGTSQAATSEQASSQYRLKIPAAGYYDANANIYRTYANVAADIGLTAAILAKGSTVLGISGSLPADMKFASGTYSYTSGTRTLTISGLSFRPRDLWIIPSTNISNTAYGPVIWRLSFSDSGALVSGNTFVRTFQGSDSGVSISNGSLTLTSATATASGITIVVASGSSLSLSSWGLNNTSYYTYFVSGIG